MRKEGGEKGVDTAALQEVETTTTHERGGTKGEQQLLYSKRRPNPGRGGNMLLFPFGF